MKTYREMTESVLQKAGTEILKKERRRRNGVCFVASSLCLVLLLTVLGIGMEQPPAVPTLPNDQPGLLVDPTDAPQQTEYAKVKITYLTNIEGQISQETVSPDVAFPLNTVIRVRYTGGLSEEEVDKMWEEEIAFTKAFRLPGEGYCAMMNNLGMITSITSNGSLTLDFSDCSTVQNVNIETTGVGKVGRSRRLFRPDPEGTPIDTIYWPNVREAYLCWTFSDETNIALSEDPTIPLESIRDTITVTIDYANGTTEILTFDITVNEEGQLFVTQRGIPTEAV